MANQEIIDRFFAYYSKHDLELLKTVMHKDVVWYFLGNHKFAGTKKV
jgi:ketosteroid isomerase-like protein